MTADGPGCMFKWGEHQPLHDEEWLFWSCSEEDEYQYCKFCGTRLHTTDWGNDCDHEHSWPLVMRRCPLCGWYLRYWYCRSVAAPPDNPHIPVLRTFDINSTAIALEELGTFLRARYRDVGLLTPRRFEELVADVFAHHGFHVRLTQQTRDNGADILVFDRNGVIDAIIECKRYRNNRHVGISSLRELVGAAVDWRVRRAKLVTSSDFSAVVRSKSADYKLRGFDIDLVAASDLLSMLEAYNERLPVLIDLTPQTRSEIIRLNLKKFRQQESEIYNGPGMG
jgi:hypothetical protein